MAESRPVNAVIVSCLIVVVVLPLVLYVAGYFALSKSMSGPVAESRCRCFRTQWQVEIYKPAARVETVLTGDDVTTFWLP